MSFLNFLLEFSAVDNDNLWHLIANEQSQILLDQAPPSWFEGEFFFRHVLFRFFVPVFDWDDKHVYQTFDINLIIKKKKILSLQLRPREAL